MSYAIEIKLNEKQRAAIDAMVERFCALPREAVNNVEKHTKNLFVEWFASKPPNKMGWPSTHFWAKQAKSVQSSSDSNNFGASVRLSMGTVGLLQRLNGGTITAGKSISRYSGKPTQFLTIPARAEAYGKRAFEFKNLRVQFGRGRMPVALVEADATLIEKTKKRGYRPKGEAKLEKDFWGETAGETGGAVMYWLVKSVTQRPDPSTIPATEMIANTVVFALSETADRIAKGGK